MPATIHNLPWRRLQLCVLLCAVVTLVSARQESALRIELDAGEYEQVTGLSPAEATSVRQAKYLRYNGTATYRFHVAQSGWYVLWVQAVEWHTDLSLDGTFLLHTPFQSGVWRERNGLVRVVSLHLERGEHRLGFSRPWHPGLPGLRRIVLERAMSPVDMARLTLLTDHTVLRRNERFAVQLHTQHLPASHRLSLRVRRLGSSAAAWEQAIDVPVGEGMFTQTLTLPTDVEGAHVVSLTNGAGFAADRELEYVVVDTRAPLDLARTGRRELVQQIDAALQRPDYSSVGERLVDRVQPAYRETGDGARAGNGANGSFFAYRLNLPDAKGHYLVEIDHPDDANRSFSLSVLQSNPSPYNADSGVQTGAPYALSGATQTHEIHFYARQRDPRLLVMNWNAGQRGAISAIRVYRLGDALPLMPRATAAAARQFGLYLEEPLRYTTYFGADPADAGWNNLLQSAIQYAEWTRYIGATTWHQTIAAYQATLWPAKNLPGYGPDDESGIGHGFLHARPSPRDPVQKDIVRLLLLVCEKYGLKFVPELQMYPNAYLVRALFADGVEPAQGTPQPWLTQSATGATGAGNQGLPWLNPVYPPVQQWTEAVVREVSMRYRDSPALDGVGIRLLGWAFGSWQSFASLQWGYDDFTVRRFLDEKGPGSASPLYASGTHARRFAELTGPRYQEWVEWRITNIARNHRLLARALTQARADLQLQVNTFGPHFSVNEYYEDARSLAARARLGWLGLMRETGIDPRRYRNDSAIRVVDAIRYPSGARAPGGSASPLGAALFRESLDPEPLRQSERSVPGGTVAQLRFYNEYMEANLSPALVGLDNRKGPDGRAMDFVICSVISPAGRNLLARYAEAMAAGNLVSLTDGGLGYILNQPQYVRDFLREYAALPAVGMVRLEGTSPEIAAWQGASGNARYIYVVNRSAVAGTVRLRLESQARILRATNLQLLPLNTDGSSLLTIEPYGLVALRSELAHSSLRSAIFNRTMAPAPGSAQVQ